MSVVRSRSVVAERRGSRRGRLAAIVLAGMMSVGVVVAEAPAASAAAPRCTGRGWRVFRAEDGTYANGAEVYFPAHSPDQVVWGPLAGGPDVIVGKGYWSCSLVPGSTGEGVRALQGGLNACYSGIIGTPLITDGQFGTKTKAALIKVQQWHGIEANGQYGPQTARSIFHFFYNWHVGGASCLSMGLAGYPGNSG